MSKENLRQHIAHLSPPTEQEQPRPGQLVIDEDFWKEIFSLYRLRLSKDFGYKAVKTVLDVGQTFKDLQVPLADETQTLITQIITDEQSVFSLMSEEPWNINPLSPVTERERTFIHSLDGIQEYDEQKRSSLVKEYFTPSVQNDSNTAEM